MGNNKNKGKRRDKGKRVKKGVKSEVKTVKYRLTWKTEGKIRKREIRGWLWETRKKQGKNRQIWDKLQQTGTNTGGNMGGKN